MPVRERSVSEWSIRWRPARTPGRCPQSVAAVAAADADPTSTTGSVAVFLGPADRIDLRRANRGRGVHQAAKADADCRPRIGLARVVARAPRCPVRASCAGAPATAWRSCRPRRRTRAGGTLPGSSRSSCADRPSTRTPRSGRSCGRTGARRATALAYSTVAESTYGLPGQRRRCRVWSVSVDQARPYQGRPRMR